ncbi:MAG: hypothetical protein Q8R47_00945, partial [Nanoarchaeota archaeon]|nr:hypothetical protein [Nanoarchaeota archaeon]
MVTAKEARESAEKYVDEFVKPPFTDYVGVVGSAPIRNVCSPSNLIARIRNFYIVGGRLPTRPAREDNVEDWCLMVGVKRKLPRDLDLPS